MYLTIGLDKTDGCRLNESEKKLYVSDIHSKIASNLHVSAKMGKGIIDKVTI